MAVESKHVNNTNKKVTSKNWTPLTKCIGEIINSQVDDAQDL